MPMTMTPRDSPAAQGPPTFPLLSAGTESLLAQAHALAERTARAELGRHAHGGIGASDIAQEVVIRLAAMDISGLANWQAWVTTVARNRARDALRAQRRHRHESLGDFADAGGGVPRALASRMRALGPSGGVLADMAWTQAVQVLSPRERDALQASLDGWSNQQIAERMGYASGSSVAVILTRARAKLRTAFPAGPQREALLAQVRLY